MLKEERHKQIMKEINLHNKALSVDLSERLNVSEDTIRRDLKELAEQDKIVKVHGGAISKSSAASFASEANVYALQEKQLIAQKAVTLLKNDMIVLFEGGSTLIELAKCIPSTIHLTAFTVSPQVALVLSNKSNIDVIVIGGKLTRNATIHTGASVINELHNFKADICFMGVNAFSMTDGLTDIDWEMVQVNKAMIRVAAKTALLTISEKLNITKKLKVAGPEDVDYLITELDPDTPLLQGFKTNTLTIL